MNVQDSPTKAIDAKLCKSVERAVRKERNRIITLELEGVKLDSSVKSMTELCEAMWMLNALDKHKQ